MTFFSRLCGMSQGVSVHGNHDDFSTQQGWLFSKRFQPISKMFTFQPGNLTDLT